MAFLLGFLIAFAIGVTGVGAGTVTAPLLILALGLPRRWPWARRFSSASW